MKIEEIAEKLYLFGLAGEPNPNQTILLWSEVFTIKQLVALWENCKKDLDIVYDDEVYNALQYQNYFNK